MIRHPDGNLRPIITNGVALLNKLSRWQRLVLWVGASATVLLLLIPQEETGYYIWRDDGWVRMLSERHFALITNIDDLGITKRSRWTDPYLAQAASVYGRGFPANETFERRRTISWGTSLLCSVLAVSFTAGGVWALRKP